MQEKRHPMLRHTLTASRWLMAPLFLGLIASLLMLVVVFLREVAYYLPQMLDLSSESAILAVLTLIDLTLVANLLLIVIVSSFETFAPPPRGSDQAASVDFSTIKIKLIASIVAISGIELLKRFMSLPETLPGAETEAPNLFWPLAIHLTFVVSGVLLAMMDWLSGKNSRKAA